jgi:hypothetical protein
VVEVGHAGRRDGLSQTEVHVLRELMEEAATGDQQDGHLVEHEDLAHASPSLLISLRVLVA